MLPVSSMALGVDYITPAVPARLDRCGSIAGVARPHLHTGLRTSEFRRQGPLARDCTLGAGVFAELVRDVESDIYTRGVARRLGKGLCRGEARMVGRARGPAWGCGAHGTVPSHLA